MEQPIIVTRHAALIEFLREELGITGEVIPHATEEAVEDRRVIGVLPLHLAAAAESITTVDLDIPAELRGKELTLEQLKQHYKGITTYVVRVEPLLHRGA